MQLNKSLIIALGCLGLMVLTGCQSIRALSEDSSQSNLESSLTDTFDPSVSGIAEFRGTAVKWHPMTLSFDGSFAQETDNNPNPFLDYRMDVAFISPSGQSYIVPGYFAGDGNGGSSGSIWRVNFAPDEAGTWSYAVSFRSGQDVAVLPDPLSGVPIGFNGEGGSFQIADLDPDAAGFLGRGRLEHVDSHFLKFQDGSFYLKSGTNSPGNFLAWAGFDGAGETQLRFDAHMDDWRDGDPLMPISQTDVDAKGIIGALNYLGTADINSIDVVPLDFGQSGPTVYPFIGSDYSQFNKTHYDVSKLDQWQIVLEHAQREGVAIQVRLEEGSPVDREWLDGGDFGIEHRLYYREMIARFGHLLALNWDLGDASSYKMGQLDARIAYLQALDWQDHPVSYRSATPTVNEFELIQSNPQFSTTSVRYNLDEVGQAVELWRHESAAAGNPWVIEPEEGMTLSADPDDLRKSMLYDIYFSGGNIDWTLESSSGIDDLRRHESLWRYTSIARGLMEDQLPFWEMTPADDLLTGESNAFGGGEVFAKVDEVYAIYLPNGSETPTLNLINAPSEFERVWFNPRTGETVGQPEAIIGGRAAELGAPPQDPTEDWIILLFKTKSVTPTPVVNTPTPDAPEQIAQATPTVAAALVATPTYAPTSTPTSAYIDRVVLINADTDEEIQVLNSGDRINFAALGTTNLNVRADVVEVDETIKSVSFTFNRVINVVDNGAPYSLGGDYQGDYRPWTPTIGDHTLRVVPFAGLNGDGAAGVPYQIEFRVVNELVADAGDQPPQGIESISDAKIEATDGDEDEDPSATLRPTQTPLPDDADLIGLTTPTPIPTDEPEEDDEDQDEDDIVENDNSVSGAVPPTATATSTPTATATSTPTATATSTPTATATSMPTATATSTPTATATSTPTSTATSTPTATATSTPTATATSTPTSTATSTPTATATSTPISTATSTPTATATSTPTATATSTPTATATSTPTATATSTPTATPTNTPTATPTNTPTATPTNTPTATATSTPTSTATSTPTSTATSTPTATATSTPTSTATSTPTSTATSTPTATATSTPTSTATNTPTATPTNTPTSTPTNTPTATPTNTPTATPTNTPTATATSTPSVTPTQAPTLPPTATPVVPFIADMILVNADTEQAIRSIISGETLSLEEVGTSLNIEASIDPFRGDVGSVVFYLDDEVYAIENLAPYTFSGDSNGNYRSWTPPLGRHTISAVPYSGRNGTGVAGQGMRVSFEVVEQQDLTAPTPTLFPTEVPPPPPTATPDPSLAPLCNGVRATIYVLNGRVIGGESTARRFSGVIRGTNGDDVIVGTDARDSIVAQGGADLICGAGGDDTIRGGSGSDIIYGGDGDDLLLGESGNDWLFGDAGDDELNGGRGADICNGGTAENCS